MPKLHCPCGFVHNLTPIPDDGWRTVRDAELDSHWEAIERGDSSEMIALFGLLYECPNCGRLMWQKPGEKVFVIYDRKPPATQP
jgi:hypothetical protein